MEIGNELEWGEVDMGRVYGYEEILRRRKRQFIMFNEEQQRYFLPEGFHQPRREQVKK